MFATPTLVVLAIAVSGVAGHPRDARLDQYKYVTVENEEEKSTPVENEASHWRSQAVETLSKKMRVRPIEGVAKNVILFLGDGMSIPTVTAARIYLGQLTNLSGENSHLSFEKFPFTGLSKTYCVNKQVADSACSSTAYLAGVKANYGTLGVTAAVSRGNCTASSEARSHVDTILSWAQDAGKATGLVTTTRITHASPAGHYAHIAERDWESDFDVGTKKDTADPDRCEDIASQLVRHAPGKHCKVILGGGRAKFTPADPSDPDGTEGERRDGRDLVQEWRQDKKYRGKAVYVTDRQQLMGIDVKHTDFLLGLFQPQHMKYHLEEDSDKQPTLAEMTRTAIRLLSKEKRGYYLFVEGGKIDLAHHKNYARRALDETVEFHKAVQTAVDMVDEEETLIVVTADHAHTMSIAGYPQRGGDILGANLHSEKDDLDYPTLSYANGPSAEEIRDGKRRDISNDDLSNFTYQYPSLVRLKDETHGGDDVAVFARGPWAHLLTGNFEQNLIPHVMAFAAEMGPLGNRLLTSSLTSSSTSTTPVIIFLITAVAVLRLFR